MTDDIRLAFSHPIERSVALRDRPFDRLSVRDFIVEVEIGAFQQERGTRQRVRFNIVVEVLPLNEPINDDVDRILSYDKVTEAVETELAAERINLLETLAERVADRILLEPQAERVFVRIEKLDRGPFALGVEIVRGRDEMQNAAVPTADTPKPLVLFLSNEAIASHLRTGWIDEAQAMGLPLILCVGAGELEVPQTGHAMTQRRIDLLAIEQNAWSLAAKDHRCKVVSTRTELEWAMRNDQICIWAPSKMVLDAVDGPSSGPSDAAGLCAWFAQEMEAAELVLVGAQTASRGLPTRAIPVTKQSLA